MADPVTNKSTALDPVLERRRSIGRIAELGKRIGWMLFGAAVVAFVVGFIVGFRPWLTTAIISALVIGSLVLAPAIVFSFAVAATDREEQGGSYGH